MIEVGKIYGDELLPVQLAGINQLFHQRYQRRLIDILATFGQPEGRPVCLIFPRGVKLLWRGQEREFCIRPAEYHELKALCHAYFAIQLGESEDAVMAGLGDDWAGCSFFTQDLLPRIMSGEGLQEAIERSARIELEALHGGLFSWWRHELSEPERAKCGFVIPVPHQARARRLSIQYVERLTGRCSGLGALGEDGLVIVEGIDDESGALLALARHYLDQEAADRVLGDRFGLQQDLLGNAASSLLGELFNASEGREGGNEAETLSPSFPSSQ